MVSIIFYLLYLDLLFLRRERRRFSGTEDISHSYIYGWVFYLRKGWNWAAEIAKIAKGIQIISELQLNDAILESDSAAAWQGPVKMLISRIPILLKWGSFTEVLQEKYGKKHSRYFLMRYVSWLSWLTIMPCLDLGIRNSYWERDWIGIQVGVDPIGPK